MWWKSISGVKTEIISMAAVSLGQNIPETDTFNRFTNPDYYLNFTNAAAWNKIFKRSYIEQLKLDFQPVRNGNDVYFTVNAIGLADRITVLDENWLITE